jgi:hypothetical protein
LDFCNVTVTYSHTGFNDRTHVQIWLPLDKEQWNGRFQGTGGGGYVAGLGDEALAPAIAAGYSAACTDAGHPAVNDAESVSVIRTICRVFIVIADIAAFNLVGTRKPRTCQQSAARKLRLHIVGRTCHHRESCY